MDVIINYLKISRFVVNEFLVMDIFVRRKQICLLVNILLYWRVMILVKNVIDNIYKIYCKI